MRMTAAEVVSVHPSAEQTEPARGRLYNRKEAAEYLLVHPRSVTRYRVSGKLPAVYNEDNRIRYREEDLKDCYCWKWGRRP